LNQKKLNEEKSKVQSELKALMSFGRFDLDYIEDAIIFLKSDTATPESFNAVHIKRPSERYTA